MSNWEKLDVKWKGTLHFSRTTPQEAFEIWPDSDTSLADHILSYSSQINKNDEW